MNAENGDGNPPVQRHRPNCWKVLGFGGTGLLVLIIIAIVTGGTDEDDGTEARFPHGHTISRCHTQTGNGLRKLLECDTTTLGNVKADPCPRITV